MSNLFNNQLFQIMEQGQNLTTEVTMDDINNGIADENGVIYSKDGKRLLSFGNNKSETYTIKGGTIVICDNAFKRSTNLQKIKIPESIKKIGYSAFQECFELQKINLPNSITMIGDWCFFRCRRFHLLFVQPLRTALRNWGAKYPPHV